MHYSTANLSASLAYTSHDPLCTQFYSKCLDLCNFITRLNCPLPQSSSHLPPTVFGLDTCTHSGPALANLLQAYVAISISPIAANHVAL